MSDIFLRIYFHLILDPFITIICYVLSFLASGIKLFARYWIGPGEESACYMVMIGKTGNYVFSCLFLFLLSYRGTCLGWGGVFSCPCSFLSIFIRITYAGACYGSHLKYFVSSLVGCHTGLGPWQRTPSRATCRFKAGYSCHIVLSLAGSWNLDGSVAHLNDFFAVVVVHTEQTTLEAGYTGALER